MAILALHQYIGNLRLNKNVGKLIATIEDLIRVKSALSVSPTEIPLTKRYWKKIWINLIGQYLNERNMQIQNKHN